ncbi:helix-turn-helix domain-containing protein [Clostridium sp. LIBA-8841]|uniref:helix-turn-helix domain-containing protein n=1 Tax=Clostridium sp. LIBA-8841 TaxID=2987530 RepID=UPI002AC50DA6|nr:helix-turn-helix domain-containing protein [Clostridium sp. LIBA-8841]MDZ5253634.1 helix-turn-helix domain-containing protein [Clostridium sp. LIBA-8841]
MSIPRSIKRIQNSDFVTISELVKLTGMRYSTLKYYTEEGLLPFEQIDNRLVRRFPREEVIKRIEEIKELKANGLTIEGIKKILLGI